MGETERNTETAPSSRLARLPLFEGAGEPKPLIGRRPTLKGRHYTKAGAGAASAASAGAEILGGGWSGRARCRRWSSRAWSGSGWV